MGSFDSGCFSSFGVAPSGSGFPGLGSREGFLPREGGASPQQDNKSCCFTCGTVHECWDPLGLSSIDEDRGFRCRAFSSGVRVLVFSSGVSQVTNRRVLLFRDVFLSSLTRTHHVRPFGYHAMMAYLHEFDSKKAVSPL